MKKGNIERDKLNSQVLTLVNFITRLYKKHKILKLIQLKISQLRS